MNESGGESSIGSKIVSRRNVLKFLGGVVATGAIAAVAGPSPTHAEKPKPPVSPPKVEDGPAPKEEIKKQTDSRKGADPEVIARIKLVEASNRTAESVQVTEITAQAVEAYRIKLDGVPNTFDFGKPNSREIYNALYQNSMILNGFGPEWLGKRPIDGMSLERHKQVKYAPPDRNLAGVPYDGNVTFDTTNGHLVFNIGKTDPKDLADIKSWYGETRDDLTRSSAVRSFSQPHISHEKLLSQQIVTEVVGLLPQNSDGVYCTIGWERPDFEATVLTLKEAGFSDSKIKIFLEHVQGGPTGEAWPHAEVDGFEHIPGEHSAFNWNPNGHQWMAISGLHSDKTDFAPNRPIIKMFSFPQIIDANVLGPNFDPNAPITVRYEHGPSRSAVFINGVEIAKIDRTQGESLYNLPEFTDTDGTKFTIPEVLIRRRLNIDDSAGTRGWPPNMVPDSAQDSIRTGLRIKSINFDATGSAGLSDTNIIPEVEPVGDAPRDKKIYIANVSNST